MPKWSKYLVAFFALLSLISIACLQPVDRTPYQEEAYYLTMMERIDSLYQDRLVPRDSDTLLIGWSKVNITPSKTTPMAGYGGREPMEFETVRDSIYIRTVVFDDGNRRSAYVSADLLIMPPEVTEHLRQMLPKLGWDLQQVFLTATHSHSSIGGWSPGLVGELFAGEYDPELPKSLAEKVLTSIRKAEENLDAGYVSYNELQAPELVKNRLVKKEGVIDPNFKIIGLLSGDRTAYLTSYSAHATCLSRHTHELSGDFPSHLVANLEKNDAIDFALYTAGPVGSMGPRTIETSDEYDEVIDFGDKLTEYVDLLGLLGPSYVADVSLDFWRVPLEIRTPMAKISRNIAFRPWLFRIFFGEYPIEVSFLQFGNTIFIGLPGDFSGELALPLYESAREKGLNLVINSFNGGYIGYIIKDQWYDLSKYEARTMSWYGPDNGAYISNVIEKIIEKITIEE
ncbi:MAG: neutral/alkaline non-lysosomal ceramidase N-terminal domain-containing protein [Cytophagales bacterium]|nr:neutral/alkaline non-lysosomal ceramidase N-terminal domain-containing protein [Cytophagales bacterium]